MSEHQRYDTDQCLAAFPEFLEPIVRASHMTLVVTNKWIAMLQILTVPPTTK
jgi:hypothetical protein